MILPFDWEAILSDIAYLLGEPCPTNELLRDPCSTSALAEDLKVPRGTLRGWLDGSEPKHSDGEAILDRWCVLSGRRRDLAPRLRHAALSAAKFAG